MPCGARQKSPRTSSKVQIIFYFSPLKSEDIYIYQKILIDLESCSRSFLILWVPIDTIQSLGACRIKLKKIHFVNLCF